MSVQHLIHHRIHWGPSARTGRAYTVLTSVITSVSYLALHPNVNDRELQQDPIPKNASCASAGEKRSLRCTILLCWSWCSTLQQYTACTTILEW